MRNTFAEALKVVWQATLGISLAGFFCSLGMRQLQLHTNIDDDWGREDLPNDPEQQFVPLQETVSKREHGKLDEATGVEPNV